MTIIFLSLNLIIIDQFILILELQDYNRNAEMQ